MVYRVMCSFRVFLGGNYTFMVGINLLVAVSTFSLVAN